MDKLVAMRTFVAIVDHGSLSAAARVLDRLALHGKEPARATKFGVRFVSKPVELQVELESIPTCVDGCEAPNEISVLRKADAIGIYVDLPYASLETDLDHPYEVRVYSRLASGELHDIGVGLTRGE